MLSGPRVVDVVPVCVRCSIWRDSFRMQNSHLVLEQPENCVVSYVRFLRVDSGLSYFKFVSFEQPK